MDIWKAIRTVGRRWYVSLAVLVLCAAVTSAVVAKAEATYTSEATITLLPPNLQPAADSLSEAPLNPFLQSGVALTARAVAFAGNSEIVANHLRAEGLGDVSFSVVSAENSQIIFMSAKSNSAQLTQRAIAVVVAEVQKITSDLQIEAEAPQRLFITAQVLAPPPAYPTESLAAKTKIAMGMAAGSLLAIVASALLFDNVEVRRRARRAAARARAAEARDETDLEADLEAELEADRELRRDRDRESVVQPLPEAVGDTIRQPVRLPVPPPGRGPGREFDLEPRWATDPDPDVEPDRRADGLLAATEGGHWEAPVSQEPGGPGSTRPPAAGVGGNGSSNGSRATGAAASGAARTGAAKVAGGKTRSAPANNRRGASKQPARSRTGREPTADDRD